MMRDDFESQQAKIRTLIEIPTAGSLDGQLLYAHMFAAESRDRFRYVHDLGQWLEWDGQRWAEALDGAPVRAMDELIRAHAASIAVEGAAGSRVKSVTRMMTKASIMGSLDLAAHLKPIAITVADLDADAYLLNTPGGTLDLHTLELRRHEPADHITKITRGTPKSPREGQHPFPQWQKFLTQILPDNDVRSFLGEVVGQALCGTVTEHVLPIWTGTGANGKGATDRALTFALGDYAITAEPDLLLSTPTAHPTGLTDLRGVRWATVSESDDGRTLAGATMKRLTGGDVIRARRMRQDFFQFTPSHTVTLITNHLPGVRGDDPAIWRRVRVVPFDVVISPEDQDRDLDHKLELIADEVMSWAVAGWVGYQRRGRLDAPPAVTVATDSYQRRSDAVAQFIEEACVVNPSMSTTTQPLHQRFEKWARSEGIEPLGRTAFGEALDRLGFPASKSNGALVRRGICAQADPDQVSWSTG